MLFREPEMAALEALLFVAKNPLTLDLLEEILELDSAKISELLDELRRRYSSEACGLMLLELNGGFKLATKPEVARYIEILYKQPAQTLSNAALEVLSIIAYKQPVTRGEVDFIRGVQSDRALMTLVEKGLVKDVGRKEGPGRPILYGTTEHFLLHFGLSSLEDLPNLEAFALSEREVASSSELEEG
ncbi:condensin subunit ScpB [Desulfosporosinus acidiphilus SJ4]|uniref:Segregation and condensation protein B n=1 Tax=Desulfosporosinus acidiphilus (strain DSM 22704 / JCM 16185 / SJ4) TaxID=646529 RepID=I4D8R0_DESAJ|nr:SMC-Scp complex subunit ScpB [Desulfosporosinus acidiphilus]AFM42184.1 condensin subunit ScpB [Desulfosporosinus acidiphilus SJ4]